ncbi:hypothetical protein OCOJLMKI_4743 [Methylobacterium iners]|uniref:Uncharacterized protein n=1 Tax=Methylobacterium iners TaxID=418707 RepID=A0ABQ4S390_9HYPH|nr:hypothetical protein OCOJLMKI_4743 [Methylobacterium iners]
MVSIAAGDAVRASRSASRSPMSRMGLPQRSVDLPRLLGVGLLIGGVVLIRR